MDPFREFAVRLLRPFLQYFALNVPFAPQNLASNRLFIRRLKQSSKVSPLMDVNGAVCFVDACKLIEEEAGKFRHPFLLMTGEKDNAICNEHCRDYINHCTLLGDADKEHTHFDQVGHEMHRDIGREKVFARVLQYLAKRLSHKTEGYQKPEDFRHGFIGKRKHSFKYRIFRVVVLFFIVIKLL